MTRTPKECLTGFNGEALLGGVPRPKGGRLRKSAPGLCRGVVYMHLLRGMIRLDRPKKVRLADEGSDRWLGRGVARADMSYVAGVGLL